MHNKIHDMDRSIHTFIPFLFLALPFMGNGQTAKTSNDLSGRHGLTLQWISFSQPGRVDFKKTGKDTYDIEGRQSGRKGCDSCHVYIKGKMVRVDAKTLKFTGRIETLVDYNNNGEPCVTEGEAIFLSTGTRKYWRLQHMQRCGDATDYVDIYFK